MQCVEPWQVASGIGLGSGKNGHDPEKYSAIELGSWAVGRLGSWAACGGNRCAPYAGFVREDRADLQPVGS